MIKPTVGRVVWFYPSTRTGSSTFHPPTLNDPLAAIVSKVIDSRTLNLVVFDAQGVPHAMTGVLLIQEGEDVPEDGYYAEWMPYQIGQAKKAEDAQHADKQLAIAADRDADTQRWRAHAIDLALRTPGLGCYQDVLAAAKAYQEHIAGVPAVTVETKTYADGTTATGTAPLPETSPTAFSGLTFGDALVAIKGGTKVARAGWNGKGMFVYLVPAAAYPAQTGAAKSFFGEGSLVPYNAYLALKGADDTVSTWAPSGSDALAEDWLIVE